MKHRLTRKVTQSWSNSDYSSGFSYIGVFLVSLTLLPSAHAEQYSLAVIPDTQNYSQLFPDTYDAQTQWLADSQDAYDIVFTTHVGDIVQYGANDWEWDNANRSMGILDDAGMNYAVTPGNHDLYGDNGANYRKYYGPSRFSGMPTYQSHSPSEMSSYHKVEMGGHELMMLSLDIDAPDAEMQWAQSVLDANPDTPTVLTTHIIMDPTGNILDVPYMRKNGNYPPAGNAPQDIWDDLVLPNEQIFLTLNGHYFGARHETAFNAAGLEVHRMLIDYQGLANGGDGYLRLLEFDFDSDEIRNITYSPTKDDYLTGSDHEFSIGIDFENRFQNVVQLVPEGTLLAPNVRSFSSADDTKGGRTVDQLVGGEGIVGYAGQEAVTLDATHAAGTYDAAAEGMWTSKFGEPIDQQYITFDLGRVVNLDKVAIWQFAEGLDTYNLDFSDRGAKEIMLSVASVLNPESEDFTEIGTITLDQYAQGEELSAQIFDLVGANEIRYVKFDFHSNWGDPDYIGLSEVRFLTGVPIPEPTSALVLAGLAAPVLMRRFGGRRD